MTDRGGVNVPPVDRKRYQLIWEHGSCQGHDPELFFNDHNQFAKARLICRSCPVQTTCLDLALTYGERGVWGGTSERERRRLRNVRVSVVSA